MGCQKKKKSKLKNPIRFYFSSELKREEEHSLEDLLKQDFRDFGIRIVDAVVEPLIVRYDFLNKEDNKMDVRKSLTWACESNRRGFLRLINNYDNLDGRIREGWDKNHQNMMMIIFPSNN